MPVPSPLLSVADGKMTGSAGWDMCESGDASQRRRSEDDAGGNSTEEHRSRQPPPAFVDCFCDYDSLVLFLGVLLAREGNVTLPDLKTDQRLASVGLSLGHRRENGTHRFSPHAPNKIVSRSSWSKVSLFLASK
mmetsp:Transcript_31328/g.62095  ORF Transcript_31328/g.62095 Transcript_31328/m.62095 type:complete len:134 (-) Transcript_31328:103-504(-)